MAGGWDGAMLVLLFTSHSTILSDSGHFYWHWNPLVVFIFGSVESDTGVDPGFLDSFTKWGGGGGGGG